MKNFECSPKAKDIMIRNTREELVLKLWKPRDEVIVLFNVAWPFDIPLENLEVAVPLKISASVEALNTVVKRLNPVSDKNQLSIFRSSSQNPLNNPTTNLVHRSFSLPSLKLSTVVSLATLQEKSPPIFVYHCWKCMRKTCARTGVVLVAVFFVYLICAILPATAPLATPLPVAFDPLENLIKCQ